ncbi:MAG TPA: hypothetical protein PLF25_12285, partial [Accumulibacter sp.]|nr:hypothetical protein [Accumulibacter sp.]
SATQSVWLPKRASVREKTNLPENVNPDAFAKATLSPVPLRMCCARRCRPSRQGWWLTTVFAQQLVDQRFGMTFARM